MSQLRDLAWRLNWYRQSELDGALLLGRMVRQADDPYLIEMMTKHAADESVHAALWTQAIKNSGLPIIRIFRGYQSYYSDYGVAPASVGEVLAITHVFEKRVDQRFKEEHNDQDLPVQVRQTFERLIDDEQQHLDWIATWLESHPELQSLLSQYHDVDVQLYNHLQQYIGRTWDVPGLGEEFSSINNQLEKEFSNAKD